MNRGASLLYRHLVRRRDLAGIIAVGALNAACVAVLIMLIRRIIGLVQDPAAGLAGIWLPLALLGGTSVVYAIVRGLEFTFPEIVGLRAVQNLRMRIYQHMAAMAPRQIQHRSRGSLILRLTGDLTMLRTWISRGLGRGTVALASLIACMGAVAWFSPWLAVAIAGCFLAGSLLSLFVGRGLQRVTAMVRRRRSMLTSNIVEQVNALAVVQVFGRTRGEAARLSRQNDGMTSALVREAVIRGMLRTLASGMGWLALTVVCALGALVVARHQLDVGGVVAALIATRLMQADVRTLGLAHDYWRRAEISRRKVEDFLDSSSRTVDPTLEKLRGWSRTIVFENVSVGGALEEICANIPAGRHVAVVGPSGSGKSTLLNVVARLSECDTGKVIVGRQSVAECTFESLWSNVGIVSPDLPLMRGTLRRNLAYRCPQASGEEIDQLVDMCGLRPLIDSLPGGLDFWLTEGGANLPTGARQQIAIARALLGNPSILLLDNATSGLDEEARAVFASVLRHYGGTVLSVSRERAEIEACDLVWTMENGRLVRSDSPQAYFAHGRNPAGAGLMPPIAV